MIRETPIYGVDFSGAKTDKNTWIASGFFNPHNINLASVNPITRRDLVGLLTDIPNHSVVSLDFPFSLPIAFLQSWAPQARTMPDVWDTTLHKSLHDFIIARDTFVKKHGEVKREGDYHFRESYSCLHKSNPNMLPMTYHGMRLLAKLQESRFNTPPLEPPATQRPTLLEAMPGAALRAFGLPYKGYKNGSQAINLRKLILQELITRFNLIISDDTLTSEIITSNHDCLDAIINMVVSALWSKSPGLFLHPPDNETDEVSHAQLEGWLYAPTYISK